jgi:hypothetical protein
MLIKTGLTLTAFAAAAYSRWLGKKLEAAGVDSLDHTDLADDVMIKLRRQQMLNRVIPLLSGSLVVVGAVEGERLRSANSTPANPVARVLEKVTDTVGLDKFTLDQVKGVAGTVGDKVGERVDLHKITPDFIEERRLPDAISKLAS